ncbi:MAG: hypothetical protein COB49_01560 [Alphaproteobacteria bacterium]|nr:MAG: hypothetical protein COB49_01560 [Alphaproteobacteria bacterium]
MNDPDKPSPWGRRNDNLEKRNSPPRRPQGPDRKSRFPLFLVGVIAFLFILVIAAWLMPSVGEAGIGMSGLFYDGLLLAFVGAGLWAHMSSSPGMALRYLAIWVIIFGVLALGYSVWTGGGRLGGELDAARGINEGDSIRFRADTRGHYFVRARVNGVEVLFMVDTGATDVALTKKDARAIGLPMDRLNYSMPYKTANGVAYGAPVRLSTIELGPIMQKNIMGSVLSEGLEHSLLGMSFLNRLAGYKVVGGILTLYPGNPT